MVQWRYFGLPLSVGVGCDESAVEVGAAGISASPGMLMGKGRVICCKESCWDGGGGNRAVTRGLEHDGSGTRAKSTLNGSSTAS